MVAASTMAAAATISPCSNKLRTYIVLNRKSSLGRLASFTDVLDDPMAKNEIPDECIAYESYAAVASRFHPSSPQRELRWSDLNRPRLHLASFLSQSNKKPLSQKARKRQVRRAQSSGNQNEHLVVHALELCFEFLDISDLARATAVCIEFRDVVMGSSRLLLGLYARKWSNKEYMAPKYYGADFSSALAMYQGRRKNFEYELSTRSQITKLSNGTYEVYNDSLLRSFAHGAIDSIRGVNPLPALSCALALQKRVSYFEVTMKGCGSVGMVSLSEPASCKAYGYGSDEHLGWKGVSFGYHGNDGDFVYNDGSAKYGGEWKPFGPSWGGMNTQSADGASVYTIGCGLNMATRELFFTLNGKLIGVAPVTVPVGDYAAAVSLHEFHDKAIVNAGSAPFQFDVEGYCASL
ncbi:hypothetical protein Poli38472_008516 [Pythium oligandrum]|uniref:SPRY domain-containing protein n=1 Tax=Pythium oligandrum TaxID=41045 RepID=A0A8K1C3W1_PYTOL|nr:hypothetical protein Poli38472_008516 [Pythium oligandrum]|eukprot:TMW55868.1 hypothetical protein Poli38472_008516 [Pythium oligandrum]